MDDTGSVLIERTPIVPERLALAAICVLYSAFALVAFSTVGSPSIKAIDSTPLALSYLGLLFVGGSVSLAGTLRRWPRLEAIGQFFLMGDWFCFGSLGLINGGTRSIAFSSILYTLAIASTVVWWQQLGGPVWRSWRARRKAAR